MGPIMTFVNVYHPLYSSVPSSYITVPSRVGSGRTSGYNFAVSGATSKELVSQAWNIVR